MKKIYLFAISVMLLATSCGHKKEGDATLIRPVKTATASSQSVIRKDFSGIVEAVNFTYSFLASGEKLLLNELALENGRIIKIIIILKVFKL